MCRPSPRSWLLAPAGLLTLLAASCSDNNGTTTPPLLPPGDETPPAAIADLAAGSTTHEWIRLTWTAPGDDDTVGTARTYSLRYATTPLTEENWAAATEVAAPPSPDSAGSGETFRVTGLSDRTVYFFGLKTADEVPNWSLLSNVATDTAIAGPAPDGAWSPLGTGTYEPVDALQVYQGDLYIGGRFEIVGDRPMHNIARWNGMTWNPLGTGTDRHVRCLDVYDGDLIVGGNFPTAGGIPVRNIARWNGIDWNPMSSGIDGPVFDLAAWDGSLIAAGDFVEAGGAVVNHIARWDEQGSD